MEHNNDLLDKVSDGKSQTEEPKEEQLTPDEDTQSGNNVEEEESLEKQVSKGQAPPNPPTNNTTDLDQRAQKDRTQDGVQKTDEDIPEGRLQKETSQPLQESLPPLESENKIDLKKPTRRTAIIIGIVAAVVVVGGLLVGNSVREEQERQQAIAEHDAYVDNLSTAMSDMLGGGSEAETTCNLIQRVWYSAIWEKSRSSWDSDIRDYYSRDFNTSLEYLMSSSTYQSHVSTIKSYNASVEDDMKQLTNPPEDCKEAYDTLKDLYHQYTSLTTLATDPSGSYTSFLSDFSDADSDFMTEYNLLRTQIPDKQEE